MLLKNIKQNVIRDKKNFTYESKGEIVPSVNEIIKRIFPFNGTPNNSIMKEAMDRGDYIHAILDDYFNDTKTSKTLEITLGMYYSPNKMEQWLQAAENTIDIIEKEFDGMDEYLSEIPLCHSRKKFAGTFDLVISYKGEVILIDFKTQRDYKQVSENKNDKLSKVEMQLAAYHMILEEIFKVTPSKHKVVSIGLNGIEIVDVKPNFKLFEKALSI